MPRERPDEPSQPLAARQASIPVIWLAELFTPSTISSLIGGVRELTGRRGMQEWRRYNDPVEWITSDRRRGGYYNWRRLPWVWPAGSPMVRPANSWLDGEATDQVPAGIRHIQLKLLTLTSTVTVLTAQFGLDDDRAQSLEGVLNQKSPALGSWDAKEEADKWRTSLRKEAADWLAKRFPGSFHRLAPGQLPTIEFLLTGQLRPWEPGVDSGTPNWAKILDMEPWNGYWQCAAIPSLRLQERPDTGFVWEPPRGRLGQRHRLVLAALEQEFTAASPGRDFMADPTYSGELPFVDAGIFDDSVRQLLVRWSLTALIRELEEQIADIQDFADQASRKRSSQALADTQQQLVQLGLDSRIVVNDIIRYAHVPSWGYKVLDFTEVAPPADPWPDPQVPWWGGKMLGFTEVAPAVQEEAPPVSLAESLRQGQIADGQRVSQLETDLREVLGTGAELTSASENLRLQSMVVWLTVIATIVAIVAAAAAVIALTRS